MSNGTLDKFNSAINTLMQAHSIKYQNEAREESRLINKYQAFSNRIINSKSINELQNIQPLVKKYSTEVALSGYEEYNLMPMYENKFRVFQDTDNAYTRAAEIQNELLGNQDELFANLVSLNDTEIVGKINEMNNLLYHIEQGESNRYNPQNLAEGYTPKSLKNAVNRRLLNLTNASTVLQESEGTWQVFDPVTGDLDFETINLMQDIQRKMLMGDKKGFEADYDSMITNVSNKFRYNQESYNVISKILANHANAKAIGETGIKEDEKQIFSDMVKGLKVDSSDILLPEQISQLTTMQNQYHIAARSYNEHHRLLTNDWYDEGELWHPEKIPGTSNKKDAIEADVTPDVSETTEIKSEITANSAISSDIAGNIKLDNQELDNKINNVPKDEEGGMWGEVLSMVGFGTAYGLTQTDRAQVFGKAMSHAYTNSKEWLQSSSQLNNKQIDRFMSNKIQKGIVAQTTKNLEGKKKTLDNANKAIKEGIKLLKDKFNFSPKILKTLKDAKAKEVFDVLKKAGLFKGDFLSVKDVVHQWNILEGKPSIIKDSIKRVDKSFLTNLAKQVFKIDTPTEKQISAMRHLIVHEKNWNIIGLKRTLSRDFPELVKNFFTKSSSVNFAKSLTSGLLQYEVGSELSDLVFDTVGYEPGLVADVGGTLGGLGIAKWISNKVINNPALVRKASRLIKIVNPRMAASFRSAKGSAKTKILMTTLGGILVAKDLFQYFSGKKTLEEIEKEIKKDEGASKNLQKMKEFEAKGGV